MNTNDLFLSRPAKDWDAQGYDDENPEDQLSKEIEASMLIDEGDKDEEEDPEEALIKKPVEEEVAEGESPDEEEEEEEKTNPEDEPEDELLALERMAREYEKDRDSSSLGDEE